MSKIHRKTYDISREVLYQKYVIEQKQAHEIATELDCGRFSIFYRLKKYNIPTRGNSESHKLMVGTKAPKYSGGRKVGNCKNCLIKLKNSYAVRCSSCEMINRWKDLNYKQKVLAKTFSKSRPFNKKEQKLNEILNNLFLDEYKFVGDGKFWVDRFNPDFINIAGQKKIIELYGDYWHNLPEYKKRDKIRLKIYKNSGFKTLIVWEHELKNLNKLKEKLYSFNQLSL